MATASFVHLSSTNVYSAINRCSVSGCAHQGKHDGICIRHVYEMKNHLNQPSSPCNSRVCTSEDGSFSSLEYDNDRRKRNRAAAHKSRQKKQDRVSQLEEAEFILRRRIRELELETKHLRRLLDETTFQAQFIPERKNAHIFNKAYVSIINNVAIAYSKGRLQDVLDFFHEDFVLSGPDSSYQLKGREAILFDYACTSFLYDNFQLEFTKPLSDSIYSTHYRYNWTFRGTIKQAGVSSSPEFVRLFNVLIGRTICFSGVSNYSFCGNKIIYLHRCVQQSRYLHFIVNLEKMLAKKLNLLTHQKIH